MKLNKVIKNGRKIFYGTGTHEEVESLNVAKDFETALAVLAKIRKTRRSFFDSMDTGQVNRAAYGRRKAS